MRIEESIPYLEQLQEEIRQFQKWKFPPFSRLSQHLLTIYSEFRRLMKEKPLPKPLTLTPKVAVAIIAMVHAIKSSIAIQKLCSIGLPSQAQIILRSLLEMAINLEFIIVDETEERANLFIGYDIVARKRYFDLMDRYPDKFKEFEEDTKAKQELLKHYNALKGNYPNPRSWSNKNIFKMAEEANMLTDYEFVFRPTSNLVHANIRVSTDEITESEEGGFLMDLSPNLKGTEWVLPTTIELFLKIFKRFGELLETDWESDFEIMVEEYLAIDQSMAKEAGILKESVEKGDQEAES